MIQILPILKTAGRLIVKGIKYLPKLSAKVPEVVSKTTLAVTKSAKAAKAAKVATVIAGHAATDLILDQVVKPLPKALQVPAKVGIDIVLMRRLLKATK